LDDLDYLSFLEAAKINAKDGKYDILPGDDSVIDYIYGKAKPFIDENKDSISYIVNDFGHLSAKSLELITTIHYVINDYKENDIDFTKEDISTLIHEIKPYFSKEEILNKINELEQEKVIEIL